MNYLNIARNLGVEYNVTFRVLDEETKEVVSEHVGHNQATNTMMTGIAHYLKGDGILNQGEAMLGTFIPRYISLGTMGLLNQDQTENGLPAGIGVTQQQEGESDADFEVRRYKEYMEQLPGYGADGYSSAQNNGREYFGLGPMFSVSAVKCELITPAYPRAPITYRAVLPEAESELPETMDIIFSAYISTGSLAKFRGDNDYLFITEVGMWGSRTYKNTSENGLLAAYRIVPPNSDNYDMENPANRSILQQNILRVGRNQIVQVIWKIQLGSVEQFGGYVEAYRRLLAYIETLGNGDRVSVYDAMYGTQVTTGSAVRCMPASKWNWWQETNDDAKTTATITAKPASSCLLLVCAMHRGDVEISGTGWTKILKSEPAENESGSISQWITVWAKSVQASPQEITVTQSSNTKMSVKAIALYEAVSVSVADNFVVSSVPYTPTETTGKRRLYLATSVYAQSSTIANTVYSSGDLDLLRADEVRFSAFYDYQPELNTTPSFTYTGGSYSEDSVVLVTLDITEVQ